MRTTKGGVGFGVLGAALLAAAVLGRPPLAAAAEERRLGPAPSGAVVRAASLGRDDAAADLLWLRVVQYIGAPYSEEQKYEDMELWVDGIADLSPRFELPYLLTGILLATSPSRADAADRVLERGEAVMPDRWIFPLQRGFVAYFGRLDFGAAAEHYRRASQFPGSPPYLPAFVRRLENSAASCAALRSDLGTVVGSTSDVRQSDAMKKGAPEILVHCAESEIKGAASAYKLERSALPASVDDLVAAGYLKAPPFAPPGTCWSLVGDRGKLTSCAPPGPSPP